MVKNQRERICRLCAGALGALAVCGLIGGVCGPLQVRAEAAVTGQDQEPLPSLQAVVGEELGAFFGAGITEAEMSDPKLWDLVTTHFNAVTFGNELKPDALFGYSNGSCPGTTEEELDGEMLTVPVMDFSRAERMLNVVKAWNDGHPDRTIRVRGHVLVWHSQTPEWFFHEDYDKTKPYVDKETMDKRQKWYIKTVLTHFAGEDSPYAGMFYGWDVVNEAIGGNAYRTDAEDPNEDLSQDTHGSNSSWWHIYQSNEYIINAFRYANEFAPASVELYYNDYGECNPTKMWAINALLKAVKEQEGAPGEGTRIDAMGMQGHYNMADPTFDQFTKAIETYSKTVGKVQITEFDMQSSDSYDGTDATRENEYARMAARYRLLYSMMKKANEKDGVEVAGITYWGVVDKYSWLQGRSTVGGGSTKIKPQCPLLFDDNYQPKNAFWVYADASRLDAEGHLKETVAETAAEDGSAQAAGETAKDADESAQAAGSAGETAKDADGSAQAGDAAGEAAAGEAGATETGGTSVTADQGSPEASAAEPQAGGQSAGEADGDGEAEATRVGRIAGTVLALLIYVLLGALVIRHFRKGR